MNKKYEKMAKDLSEAGRFGDTRILHVNEAELAGLGSLLPSGELPTNPETGQPEAGIITSLIIGAILGATSGGITAEQKGIPLWQGILQGAGIGMATGALTGGLGAAMGSGAQAGTQAALDASANTLVDASVQGALETGAAEAVKTGTAEAVKTGTTEVVGKTSEQAAMDTAFKEAAEAGVEEMIVSAPRGPGVMPFGQTAADITGASASGVAPDGFAEFSGEALTVNAGEMSGAPTNTPPAEGPGFIDQVASEFTQEGLADSVSREALKEYAGNPLNYIAPVMATEALLPSEYDEEDYLAGYEGPYDKTWSSSPGISWAANNGGEVKKRSAQPETPIQRVVRLAELAKRITDPTLPGKYNPLSEEPVQIKIRPSVNPSGMHRFGVTLPFNQGGLASLRRR